MHSEPSTNWLASYVILRHVMRAGGAMHEDDNDYLEARSDTPANDNLARVLRWVGLVGALALLTWVIATLAE
jgi:hypothetical protein